MKKILITGAGSYIGTSVEAWLTQLEFNKEYAVDTIDVRENRWKNISFIGYDVLLHVAGIAHIKETRKNSSLYYQVNRDMAIEIAKKAKKEGLHQFIFLSTMNVYGKITGVIKEDTIPKPITSYGKSKLQAEQEICRLENSCFKVAILRPPMIYGKDCRGNYPKLSIVAKRFPIFPYVSSKRSMLYIDNLCEFVRTVIDSEKRGVFYPQNAEFVNVGEMVDLIAKSRGKKIYFIKGIDKIIICFGGVLAKKVLGTLLYDIGRDRCRTFALEESIRRTEV